MADYGRPPPDWVVAPNEGWVAPRGRTPDGRVLATQGRRVLAFLIDYGIWVVPQMLVVGALRKGELADLYAAAHALDLDAIVEIANDDELEVALEVEVDVIGINNRDLVDFSVDLRRTFDLLTDVPAGKTVVSESGIFDRDQVEELEGVGVDAVLVGGTVMSAEDPEAAVRMLVGVQDGSRTP